MYPSNIVLDVNITSGKFNIIVFNILMRILMLLIKFVNIHNTNAHAIMNMMMETDALIK